MVQRLARSAKCREDGEERLIHIANESTVVTLCMVLGSSAVKMLTPLPIVGFELLSSQKCVVSEHGYHTVGWLLSLFTFIRSRELWCLS